MKHLVAAVVAALAFAQPLFAQPDLREALDSAKGIAKKAQADAHKRIYDEGKILVVEIDDGAPNSGMVIDAATVIAASKEKKEQFAMLLKASVVAPGIPMRWGGLEMKTHVARVQTLDEHMDDLEKGYQSLKTQYEKENPGKKYWGKTHHPSIRAELEQQLQGHDAVVLRYIHIKRSGEK